MRTWVAPELIVYGEVETITQGVKGPGLSDCVEDVSLPPCPNAKCEGCS